MEYAITSNEMFHLPEQPQHIVIGAGYIGVEFASIMNGLGLSSEVIRKDKILKGFDDDIRTGIQNGMSQHGIRFLTNTVVEKN